MRKRKRESERKKEKGRRSRKKRKRKSSLLMNGKISFRKRTKRTSKKVKRGLQDVVVVVGGGTVRGLGLQLWLMNDLTVKDSKQA